MNTWRRIRVQFAAPLALLILAGCGGQPSVKEGFASTRTLYFEVACPTGGPHCLEAKQLLEAEIPRFKYTFTPGSSRSWPYYKAYPLDADVPLDSLLPPHSQLHQLVPLGESKPTPSDYLVRIDLYTESDSIPHYMVNIYQFETGQMVLSGTSGPQVANQRPGMPLSNAEILLKSSIRFSFK